MCNGNENTFACISTVTVVFSKMKSVLNFITLTCPVKPLRSNTFAALVTAVIKRNEGTAHMTAADSSECHSSAMTAPFKSTR